MNGAFRLPPMQGRGDTQAELTELKRYLFQLVQELNAAMALLDGGSKTEGSPAEASQEQLIRRAQGQLSKKFLPRETFDGYFRAGLLYEDAAGTLHYGTEIGERGRDGRFAVSARFEVGKITLGDMEITEGEGRLTIG